MSLTKCAIYKYYNLTTINKIEITMKKLTIKCIK